MGALLGLLSPEQRLCIDEFSQVLVHESSNFDQSNGSSEEEDG